MKQISFHKQLILLTHTIEILFVLDYLNLFSVYKESLAFNDPSLKIYLELNKSKYYLKNNDNTEKIRMY